MGVLPSSPYYNVQNNTEYVRQTVAEAIRLSSPQKVVPVTWTLYDNYPRTPHWQRLSSVDLRTELEVPLQAGVKTMLLWGATSPDQKGLGAADLQLYVKETLTPLVHEICGKYNCNSGGSGGGGGDGTCLYALAAVCGQLTEHTASAMMKCDACVGRHAVTLRGAGCSARDVQVWCTDNSGGSHSTALPGRFKTDDNVTAPFSIFWLLGDRKWEPPPYDVTQYGFNENGTMLLDVFGQQAVWPDIRGHDRAFN